MKIFSFITILAIVCFGSAAVIDEIPVLDEEISIPGDAVLYTPDEDKYPVTDVSQLREADDFSDAANSGEPNVLIDFPKITGGLIEYLKRIIQSSVSDLYKKSTGSDDVYTESNRFKKAPNNFNKSQLTSYEDENDVGEEDFTNKQIVTNDRIMEDSITDQIFPSLNTIHSGRKTVNSIKYEGKGSDSFNKPGYCVNIYKNSLKENDGFELNKTSNNELLSKLNVGYKKEREPYWTKPYEKESIYFRVYPFDKKIGELKQMLKVPQRIYGNIQEKGEFLPHWRSVEQPKFSTNELHKYEKSQKIWDDKLLRYAEKTKDEKDVEESITGLLEGSGDGEGENGVTEIDSEDMSPYGESQEKSQTLFRKNQPLFVLEGLKNYNGRKNIALPTRKSQPDVVIGGENQRSGIEKRSLEGILRKGDFHAGYNVGRKKRASGLRVSFQLNEKQLENIIEGKGAGKVDANVKVDPKARAAPSMKRQSGAEVSGELRPGGRRKPPIGEPRIVNAGGRIKRRIPLPLPLPSLPV